MKMRHKKSSRSRKYGAGADAMKWLVIILLVGGLVYVGFGGYIPGLTQKPINQIGEVKATTDMNTGQCVSREGVLVGVCCSKWDPVNNVALAIDCADAPKLNDGQAMFKLDAYATLLEQPYISFLIRLNNTGNYAAKVKISAVTTSIVSGGSNATVTEIDNAFESLVGAFTLVQPNQKIDYSMVSNTIGKYIRLDIPVSYTVPAGQPNAGAVIPAFTATTGTYKVRIDTQVQDEQLQTIAGPWRELTLVITQESIGFSMEVTTI
jgi:hypothetical protein